jgi:hypothetical protein
MQEDTLNYLHRVCEGMFKAAAAIRQETDAVVATGDHIAIIKHFNHLRSANDEIKEARKSLEQISDHLSRVVIPDVVASLRERTGEKPPFNIEGVGRATVSYRFSCSILNKKAGFEWLRSNGHDGIIQETVNSSTLSAFAKDLLENDGFELPEDIFKVSTSPYTSITKK